MNIDELIGEIAKLSYVITTTTKADVFFTYLPNHDYIDATIYYNGFKVMKDDKGFSKLSEEIKRYRLQIDKDKIVAERELNE